MTEKNVLFQRTVTAILWLGGVYAALRWLLVPLLPFLAALAVSSLAEPTVTRVRRWLRVRRSFAAAAVLTGVLLVLGVSALALGWRLWTEGRALVQRLPELLTALSGAWEGVLERLESLYAAAHPSVRLALERARPGGESGSARVLTAAAEKAVEWVSAFAGKLPEAGLLAVTTVLAIYFTGVRYPEILAFLKRQLPPLWQKKCRQAARCCRETLLKWLRAELVLVLTTFLLLLAGFVWMGLDYAVLAAAVTALVDALPVLGTALVLLPWAAGAFLLGESGRALALVALYAAAVLVRSLLEPRLLAGQADLPPVTALLAMYLGFHLFGVGGAVLLPVLVMLVKQLQDAGVVRIWR